MSYKVSIVADSIGPWGARITTFQLRYPRFIHAEVLTHRAFSRSASSTRAIPVGKMIGWVGRDPARPVFWGKNQGGMRASRWLDEPGIAEAEAAWESAKDMATWAARRLMEIGVHKQIASRVLEPYTHINVIVTATDYDNFFALRCHPAAQPEIQALAVRMARAYRDHRPADVPEGGWHLPYVTDEERERRPLADLVKLCTARCARVSYLTFDGREPDPEADVALHDRLLADGHWSPAEHAAGAMPRGALPGRSANFRGWHQYRQTLRVGVHESFDFARLDEYGDRDFLV